MRCPFCGHQDSKVVDSRDVDDTIRRRRECLNPDCAGRFTTHERVQAVALYVVKKDGRREEFSREKLLGGLRKACEKRPLPAGAVEALAADIESALYQTNVPEIPSTTIGELVMERLHTLDPIAYVRFASVYRQFADLAALQEELESLASGARPAEAQLPFIGPRVHSPLSSAAPGRTECTNPYPPPGAAGADSCPARGPGARTAGAVEETQGTLAPKGTDGYGHVGLRRLQVGHTTGPRRRRGKGVLACEGRRRRGAEGMEVRSLIHCLKLINMPNREACDCETAGCATRPTRSGGRSCGSRATLSPA